MSIETHRVVIGACGWKHSGWLNDFYSDDLPEDWQLGYYSNEFPLVYVPASEWLNVPDLSEWRHDVSDVFRFVLEIPAQTLIDAQAFSAALTTAKSLAEFCLGIVFQLNQSICDDTQLFQARLAETQAVAPVCVDKQDCILSAQFKKVLHKQGIAEVWHGELQSNESAESIGLTRGSLAISRVSSEDLTMPALRKVIDICLMASSDKRISVLFLDGAPPSLEVLRKADILLNLL